MKNKYDEIPVFYCKSCLSLLILGVTEEHQSYCQKCGNTKIGRTSIEDWEILYQTENGKKFIDEL